MKSLSFFAVIARMIGAIDRLPQHAAGGRRHSWYLSGAC